MYKEMMWDYLKLCHQKLHIPNTLPAAFALHDTFMEKGDMSLTDFSRFGC